MPELTSGLQRPRRPERKRVHDVDLSGELSESPGYRVVERARPPPPEHPIRNPHLPRARVGRTSMVVGSGRWSTPGAP